MSNKSTPADIIITLDDAGGDARIITPYVLTINDVDIESLMEETHPFGVSWEESLPIGIGRMAPIELGGLWDDTAVLGPDVMFSGAAPQTPATTQRTLEITWYTGKTTAVECYVTSYKRTADRNGLTKWSATLQPTGTVQEDA